MSAETTFWYKRYEKVPKRDNKGQIIEGFIIVEAEDCLNLYDVIRGHWKDENTFVLWMRDGHEESIDKEMHPKVREEMLKQKKEIPRVRAYLLSQIELHGIDVRRFRTATELMVVKDDSLAEVIAPRMIQPEAPTVTMSAVATPARPLDTPTETQPSSGMTVDPDDNFAVV